VAFFPDASTALAFATGFAKILVEKGYTPQDTGPVKDTNGKVLGQRFTLKGDQQWVIWSNQTLFCFVVGPVGGPTLFYNKSAY
jgi:hypothetical protein